nr:hypothetical protein CFP56_18531 [Quercus suber]
MPDAKTAFDSDTLPTSTTHNEPATPCAQPYFDVKSQILNEREFEVKVNYEYVTTPVNNGNSNSKPSAIWTMTICLKVLNSEQKKSIWLLMKELENLSREKHGIKTS